MKETPKHLPEHTQRTAVMSDGLGILKQASGGGTSLLKW